jgi:hypothetical protein
MQKQEQKKGSEPQTSKAHLKEQFEAVKEKQITPLTRVVTLLYKSCCGCGCSTEEIVRTVPYDSDLKDGDRIKSMERGDKYKWK